MVELVFLSSISLTRRFKVTFEALILRNGRLIDAIDITKFYGDFPAVTGLSFSVEQGEILGFLGPNGAGKSTTMKILTGFIPPSSGTAKIAGYDIVEQSLQARKHIGYLPETVPLYEDMAVNDYLSFMGQIRGMSSSKVKNRIDEVVEMQ